MMEQTPFPNARLKLSSRQTTGSWGVIIVTIRIPIILRTTVQIAKSIRRENIIPPYKNAKSGSTLVRIGFVINDL